MLVSYRKSTQLEPEARKADKASRTASSSDEEYTRLNEGLGSEFCVLLTPFQHYPLPPFAAATLLHCLATYNKRQSELFPFETCVSSFVPHSAQISTFTVQVCPIVHT